MLWEYIADISFVIIVSIGGIVAIYYAFARRSKKRAR